MRVWTAGPFELVTLGYVLLARFTYNLPSGLVILFMLIFLMRVGVQTIVFKAVRRGAASYPLPDA
jgi:hypothetical protein